MMRSIAPPPSLREKVVKLEWDNDNIALELHSASSYPSPHHHDHVHHRHLDILHTTSTSLSSQRKSSATPSNGYPQPVLVGTTRCASSQHATFGKRLDDDKAVWLSVVGGSLQRWSAAIDGDPRLSMY